MYICLCHGVTESAIRDAVDNGARTFRQLSFATGCGTQCGSCAREARSLLEKQLETVDSFETQPLFEAFSAA